LEHRKALPEGLGEKAEELLRSLKGGLENPAAVAYSLASLLREAACLGPGHLELVRPLVKAVEESDPEFWGKFLLMAAERDAEWGEYQLLEALLDLKTPLPKAPSAIYSVLNGLRFGKPGDEGREERAVRLLKRLLEEGFPAKRVRGYHTSPLHLAAEVIGDRGLRARAVGLLVQHGAALSFDEPVKRLAATLEALLEVSPKLAVREAAMHGGKGADGSTPLSLAFSLAVLEKDPEEEGLANLRLFEEAPLAGKTISIHLQRKRSLEERRLLEAAGFLVERGARLGRGWVTQAVLLDLGKELLGKIVASTAPEELEGEVLRAWTAKVSLPDRRNRRSYEAWRRQASRRLKEKGGLRTALLLSALTGLLPERAAELPELVEAYLDLGGSPEGRVLEVRALPFGDEFLRHPLLHFAARLGEVGLARRLLDSGVSPNLRDEEGNTPLHLALRHGRVAYLLLERGADPTAKNRLGLTPLFLARERGAHPLFFRHPVVRRILDLESLALL